MITKEKRGISLIVLVITIVVMIVLGAAIILTLNNSRIIGKANKAKNDSDDAVLKEYVSALKLDWNFMSEEEKAASGFSIFANYANAKFEEKGYIDAVVDVDGEVYSKVTQNAKEAILAGIRIGNVVSYDVDKKDVKSYLTENGSGEQVISSVTGLTWVYIGVSDKGELMITPMVTKEISKVMLKGKVGCFAGAEELERLCRELYSTDRGTARSMNIDDIINLLGYIGARGAYYDSKNDKYTLTQEAMTIGEIVSKKGEPKLTGLKTPSGVNTWEAISQYKLENYSINKTNEENMKKITHLDRINLVYHPKIYWLAFPCACAYFNRGYVDFGLRCVYQEFVGACYLFNSNGDEASNGFSLRPVVSLTSSLEKELDENNNVVWNIN